MTSRPPTRIFFFLSPLSFCHGYDGACSVFSHDESGSRSRQYTALCSFQSCHILGENPLLPFAGPFASFIKRSQGLGSLVYWSKSLILEPCLLLGFNYLNKSLLLLWNEDVVLSLKLFLPQFEDVAGSVSFINLTMKLNFRLHKAGLCRLSL